MLGLNEETKMHLPKPNELGFEKFKNPNDQGIETEKSPSQVASFHDLSESVGVFSLKKSDKFPQNMAGSLGL